MGLAPCPRRAELHPSQPHTCSSHKGLVDQNPACGLRWVCRQLTLAGGQGRGSGLEWRPHMLADGLGEARGQGAGHTCWPVAELWSHAGSPPCAPTTRLCPACLFIGIWSVWCIGFSAAHAAAVTVTSGVKHSGSIRQAPGTGPQGLCRNPSTAGIRRDSKEDLPAFPLLRPRVSHGFFPGGFLAL